MLIQVNYSVVKKSDAIDQYVHDQVHKHLEHVEDRITRVEVHLHDDNGAGKSSVDDKRCTMEARPAGRSPLAVEHKGENLQRVIADTAGKLERALKRAFERK